MPKIQPTLLVIISAIAIIIFSVNSCSNNKHALTVYTALEHDQIPEYLTTFRKQHPNIEVKIVRDSTGIITARLLAEKDNPVADVIWGLAATSLLVLKEQNMLAPYAPEGLEHIDSRFRDKADPPAWVGIDAWMTGIAVNTMELKKRGLPRPTSYKDLLKPEYKDLIVMPNPASSGTGFLTVSAWLQLFGEEGGWNFMEKLDRNIALYTHSGSKPAKMAGKGEYAVGISFGYRSIVQASKGQPLATVFPEEGSGWDLEANALVKKKKTKTAARLFLDWAISEKAMQAYSRNFPIVAATNNFPAPKGFPKNARNQLIDNDLVWAAQNKKRIIAEWQRRFGSK